MDYSHSNQWNARKGRFSNRLRRVDGSFVEMGYRYFFGGSKHRTPKQAIDAMANPIDTWSKAPKSGLRVTWLGHSTSLVEIDGICTLVDPVWAERASPVTVAGPKRFYGPPAPLDALPDLDAVVISHDHYDHLDRNVVLALKSKVPHWIVPLGVGRHLRAWGVDKERISELDWWQQVTLGSVTLTATPARHFSGRSVLLTDQNKTLWAGFAWTGPEHSVFYSGDTGLHPDFETIGERLGPFDITLMETGAYNDLWADVHMGPEQAVLAHHMVGGKVMIPVHWGLFDLALHGWTEPAERAIAAGRKMATTLSILRPGSALEHGMVPQVDRWWPRTPWQTSQETPVWSRDVEDLQTPLRPALVS
mgnify:FL=1